MIYVRHVFLRARIVTLYGKVRAVGSADPDLTDLCFARINIDILSTDTVEHPDDIRNEMKRYKSVAEILDAALKRFATRPLLGWRRARMDASSPQDSSKLSYEKEYTWLTFSQVHERALAFGSGLTRILKPRSLVAIVAPNSPVWAIADIGCLLYGFVRISSENAALV
jgi:hypothetical protein